MKDFDVVVVGSGTAGQTAAYDLAEAGLKVAVVEKSDRPGGVCALSGCQPKKWFYEAAEAVARCRQLAGKGISVIPQACWSDVLREKNVFTAGVPGRTLEGFRKAGIEFIAAAASFRDRDTLSAGGGPLRARHYILAVGARPTPLPFPGAEHLMTSEAWLEQPRLPERIVFVGGGFIAFEFAHFAARLGPAGCRPLILEAADRPLGPFDADMVAALVDATRAAGIEVRTRVRIEAIEKAGGEFRIRLAEGGTVEGEQVVHGAGRVAGVAGLDLPAAGIEHTRAGILVDAGMRTSNPKVFAVGDCAATMQLARVADFEGHAAAKNILADLGKAKPEAVDYSGVPAILFTIPQLAMVGKTEPWLAEHHVPYRRSFARNLRWPTYRRVGLEHAAYKILAGEDGKILGAHFLSDAAAGLVNTVRLAMQCGLTPGLLYEQSILSPYPTRESDLLYMLKPLG